MNTILRVASPQVEAIRYSRHAGEVLDWHEHSSLSLCFVLQGNYEETIRDRTFLCRSGDVVIKAPDVRHLNTFGTRGAVCLLLEISDRFLRDHDGFGEPALAGPVQDHQLTRIGLELHEELQIADELSPIMLDSIAMRSLVSMLRVGRAESQRRLQLEASRELAKNVEALAARCLTESEKQNARRAFHGTDGSLSHSYALKRRAFRAFDELLNSERSLADIAIRAGFYDQAHFTKAFAKLFGVTPGRVRSRIGRS